MSVGTLIIEDDASYAKVLARIVREERLLPYVAASAEEGLEMLAEVRPALALVDIQLPGLSGIEAIGEIARREPNAVCIVVSGLVTVRRAVEAMRAGAFDVIEKTSEIDEVHLRLRRAMEMADLRRRIVYLEQRDRHLDEIVGESDGMQQVRRRIEEVATAPRSTVLVVGETGTGKELVARAIHRLSERRTHPMITINCAAVPDNLLESEFFGHERGAFTGADRARPGLVETAHRGTLFLDEIGELDLRLQAKLLRVLEERRFKRLGGVKEIQVDIRLIAATNKNLAEKVEAGEFREDLLYRVKVFEIRVPPLRERGDDVLLLARHFARELSREMGKRIVGFDEGAEQVLRTHGFPGNVRQLRNLVEQAIILARGNRLSADLLGGHSPDEASESLAPRPVAETGRAAEPASRDAPMPPGAMVRLLREREKELLRFERRVVQRALSRAGGNQTRAAELLGVSRYALRRTLKRLEDKLG